MPKKSQLAIEGGTPIRTKPLPWELPGVHWMGKEEEELVQQVLTAKSPFRFYGPDLQKTVEKLESLARKKYQRRYALAVNSGSAALEIAFAAIGVGPGDEVLLPGYLWVSCVSAVVRLGAIPRLVDIDETFCMNPADLKKKIGPHSKAILFVHMSGAPGNIQEIAAIAQASKLKLVEDCAQANGSFFKGKAVGTFGDIAIFSYQLNKNMTSGEGGLIICDDEQLYKRAFAIHDLGYLRNEKGRLDLSDPAFQLWGFGSRMSELTGALALAQMQKLDQINKAMRTSKWRIRKELEKIPGLQFRTILDPEGDSGLFLITIYPTAEICDRFTQALQAEGIKGPTGSLSCLTMKDWGLHWYYNIVSLVHRRSLSKDGFPWTHPLNNFAKDYSYEKGTLKKCDDLANRSALLAIASCLTEQDLNDIIHAFQKVATHIQLK